VKSSRWIPYIVGTAIQIGWASQPLFGQQQPPIAFLSDIHLQDVYAKLDSKTFNGVFNPKTGRMATLRTMESQLNSTRLFNENYFALLAALDELAKKKVKLVVLPGDFTDDGQPMNVRALRDILADYAARHKMRFFITTGNHDPVSPFGSPGGKTDFLGAQGQKQAIASSADLFPSLNAAISEEVKHWGYEDICETLSEFGFFPAKKDLFWTHPFETFDYENYTWDKAQTASSLEQRTYQLPDTELRLPDASYLVEPVPGIWLLALDGNVYSSKSPAATPNPADWSGSSVGFNLASKVKSHQLDWIKKIAAEAEKRGKRLISFSHYPLVDYHNGASEEMKALFGKGKFQLTRVPETAVSEAYAVAGLSLHFAGHMHTNQTGVHRSQAGTQLINIQVPSLAAFPPAYKILEEKQPGMLHVQTEVLEDVDRMDEFFDLYRMEHHWLTSTNPKALWNEDILLAPNFLSFNQFHLQELIRLRFINSDWPKDLGLLVNALDETSLMHWARLPSEEKAAYLDQVLLAQKALPEEGLRVGRLMEDFYLIKNGGDLGKSLIPNQRLDTYAQVFAEINEGTGEAGPLSVQLADLLGILSKLIHGLPSDDFVIDLSRQSITKK
jgi:3',5'-cyclic AMP phosphodiesterase CpdA